MKKIGKILAFLLTFSMIAAATPMAFAAEAVVVDVVPDTPPANLVEVSVDLSDYDPSMVSVSVVDSEAALILEALTGTGSVDNPYMIEDAEDLLLILPAIVGDTWKPGLHFRLMNDIDLSSVCGEGIGNWNPIGSDTDHPFDGFFDGRGHTITGLYINAPSSKEKALFGVSTGTVRDLKVEGSVSGKGEVGGIVARNAGTITNCEFSGTVNGRGDYVGGIAGISVFGTISGCHASGLINNTSSYTGGIVGNILDGSVAKDCSNEAEVSSDKFAGGIAGLATGEIIGCRSRGAVSGDQMLGGIAGEVLAPGAISECINYARVTGPDSNKKAGFGGITGYNGSQIEKSINAGRVRGGNGVGGIAGKNTVDAVIESCVNTGSVGGIDSIGGIAGDCERSYAGRCSNLGDVAGRANVGGIFGTDTHSTIIRCCNRGIISASDFQAGGILGFGETHAEYCVNAGDIECDWNAGGLAGYLGTDDPKEGMRARAAKMVFCMNTGEIDLYTQGERVDSDRVASGGLVGYAGVGAVLNRCVALGDVHGRKYIGTFVGTMDDCTIKHCVTYCTTFKLGAPLNCAIGRWVCTGDLYNFDIELWHNICFMKTAGIYELVAEYPNSKTFKQKYGTTLGDGVWFLTNGIRDAISEEQLDTFAGSKFFDEDEYYSAPDGFDFTNDFKMTDKGLRIRNLGGEQGERLEISSAAELMALREMVNCGMDFDGVDVYLTRDIDLTDIDWQPIGWKGLNDEATFRGRFFGERHTISGLDVESTLDYAGLFGRVDGKIYNLHVEGSVSAPGSTGGGHGASYIGGIVGELKGTMEGCTFTGEVSGHDYVGGIAGHVMGGAEIEDCTFLGGSVEGTGCNIGGVVGGVTDANVYDIFHTGSVTGDERVGGCVGDVSGDSEIGYCLHYAGSVLGRSKVGGIVGDAKTEKAKFGYYRAGTAATGDGRGNETGDSTGFMEALTEAEFRSASSFDNELFELYWHMAPDYPLPDGALPRMSLYANDGSGEEDFDLDAYVPACPFTRSGYDFMGWSSDPALGGSFYKPGDDVTGYHTLELHAMWAKQEDVAYVDETGASQPARSAHALNPSLLFLEDGWYFTDGLTICLGRIEVKGNVNIILKDGKALLALGGIHVPEGSSLTIWGQECLNPAPGTAFGTGSLVAQDYDFSSGRVEFSNCAAIGGDEGENSGAITINGGIVSAKSQDGAAIGGGDGADSGSIVLANGTVKAIGSAGAAAIGGGLGGNCGNVTIGSGAVTAEASVGAQAIGKGLGGSAAGTVTIAGKDVFDSDLANAPVDGSMVQNVLRSSYARVLPRKGTQEVSFDISEVSKLISDGDFDVVATHSAVAVGLRYFSSDESVATVDDNGTVHITGAGSTIISAVAAETLSLHMAKASYILQVTDPKSNQSGHHHSSGTKTPVAEENMDTGTKALTKTDPAGKVTGIEVAVSSKAVVDAGEKEESVKLPLEASAAASSESAAPIEIKLPQSGKAVRVEIPVKNLTPETVPVIVHEDGTDEIIKTSVSVGNAIILTLDESSTIKIINNAKKFEDVKTSDWFSKYAFWAAARDIMRGTGGGKFDPGAKVTRGMIGQMIFNLDGAKAGEISAAFTDVKPGDWYAESASWLQANHIAQGEGGIFGAMKPASREAVAVMLMNYAILKGYDVDASADLSAFKDAKSISEWAEAAMRWAYAKGLFTGDDTGRLDPNGTATRAQISAVICRFCEKVVK